MIDLETVWQDDLGLRTALCRPQRPLPALVSQHRLDLHALPLAQPARRQERFGLRAVMALPARHAEGQRIAEGVGHDMDFRGEAAAAAPERLALGVTFFWPAKESPTIPC
jgi:hypothetical protein